MHPESSTLAFAHFAPGEEWRAIPGYEPCAASSAGRVRGMRGHVLKPWCAGSARQYFYVSLGAQRKAGVHVLVCEAFHGPRPSPLHEVAHEDGDSTNNAADNLRWALHQSNVDDQRRHGTLHPPCLRGEAHGRAKLTAETVARLRGRKFHYGEVVELAARHGVSASTIHRAASGRTWVDS